MTQPAVPPTSETPAASGMLREACADLLRRLARGEQARAEQYLETFPQLAADDDSAVELIYTEFAAREEAGDRPQADDYLARFPKWSTKLRRQFDIHKLLGGAGPDDGPSGAASNAVADDDQPVQQFGAYRVSRRLGRGGMGTVYLATHIGLGRLAAVKVLNGPPTARSPVERDEDEARAERTPEDRFRTEVRSVAALGHPGIVQLYELGEAADGRAFAAFEYVEGGSLRQSLEGRPRSARSAAQLVLSVAEALDVAHRVGIVHCDLTPANILLTRDGRPKIADFGLARLPRSAADDERAPSSQAGEINDDAGPDVAHLSSVALAGTPGYLAPERIDDPSAVAPAGDLYSLGAVFYELLTGRPPHLGATPLDTLRQARDFDPPSPRVVVPGVPRDAATICMKCLERSPERRYASAAALVDDLRRFLSGEPIAARPVGTLERGWKWATRHRGAAAGLLTAAVALAVAGVGGAWYSVRLREALDRSEQQEQMIRGQATDLADRINRLDESLYTMQLNQAEALLERAPHQALALLHDETRCPPERRDFAWGYLVRRASQDRQTFLGHTGPIAAVALKAGAGDNSATLVTAGLDDTVRRRNLNDGAALGTLPVSTADATHVILNADGSRLAATYDDGSARLWNFAQGGAPRELSGHVEPIVAMTFFNGGRWLATASADGHVKIWDPSGAAITDWPVAEAGEILTIAAAADDQTLVVSLTGGAVRWIDSVEGSQVRQAFGAPGGATSLSFTTDGRRMLTVDGTAGTLELWQLGAAPTPKKLDLTGGFIRAAAIRPDGEYFAYATAEGQVRIVRTATLETTVEHQAHTARIAALQFTPDGRGLVSVSDDRTAKLWDVPGVREPQLVDADEFKTFAAAYSPSGRYLATGGADGVIRVSDLSTLDPKKPLELRGHGGAVRVVRFLDDERLLSGAEDNTARLWGVKDAKELRAWPHSAWVQDLSVAGDRQLFFTADADGYVSRYSLAGPPRPEVRWRGHDASIHAIVVRPVALPHSGSCKGEATTPINPSSWQVLTASRDGTVKDWTGDGKLTTTFAASQQNIVTLAATPQWLAGGDEAGNVLVWNVESRKLSHTLRGHSRGVYGLAFSPDGRTLASASGGRWVQTAGEVKLWDVAAGQVHATLEGYGAPVVFRPDGLALGAMLDGERKLAIWPADAYRPEPPN
ncbi:MAG: serine/threonine protein kinase [Planctomycetes bacterium]|nr:serine/threonine protein kinase [Planctomycetota bacterium]